jgi:hypothetical protein
MKKNICIVAVLSALSATASADPVNWTFSTDSTLDGNIVAENEKVVGGVMHGNQFHMYDPNSPEHWLAIGKIEPQANQELNSGTSPRISFQSADSTSSYHYLGFKTGDDQYQGTWYGPNGTSGDFMLKPAYVPQPPTTELPVSVATASTEGYGAAYGAAKTIDGVLGSNTTNVWFSSYSEVNPKLTMDMGSSIQVTHYELSRGYCSSQGWLAGTWIVEGSNDNSSWTTIDSVLDDQADNYPQTSCNSFGPMEAVDNPDTYRYYRFTFTASSQSSSPGVSIGELKLWN